MHVQIALKPDCTVPPSDLKRIVTVGEVDVNVNVEFNVPVYTPSVGEEVELPL
jgi:hypothetical protein